MATGNTYRDDLILVIDANWSQANQQLKAFEQRLMHLEGSVQSTNKAQGQSATVTNKAAGATEKHAKASSKASKAAGALNSDLVTQSHSFRKLSGNLSTGSLQLDAFSMRLDRASMFMWRFNMAMIPLQQIEFQLAAITAVMVGLETAAINTYRAVDRMTNTFMGMGDGVDEASAKVDFLLIKAKELPFTFEQVSSAAMAFRTSGIATTREELDRWLESAADLAAASSTEQGRDIARAAEAMVDAVNGEIRRLRNTYHVSAEEIAKYGDDTAQSLHALIDAKWGGTAENQMQTLEGSISNFMDSLIRLGVAFGKNLKEPLMIFLGIGQSVVDTMTTIVQWTDQMGGGWIAIAATAVPALGALATFITRIWMQIQGLRGGLMILTRDMGSLFGVIARLTAAMNDLAIAEANELATMEGSELALKEQIAERNRLIATIEAQSAATGRSAGAIAAHKHGMDIDVAGEWHSAALRGTTGGSKNWWRAGSSGSLAEMGTVASRTNIPLEMYNKLLHQQGKTLKDLSAAEHLFMLEEAKRLGIGTASIGTSNSMTAAEGALTAARKAEIAVVGEQILLEQRRARFTAGAVLGSTVDMGRGIGAAAQSLWAKRTTMFETGMRKLGLAMHTTSGALLTAAASGMVIYGSLKKIQKVYEDSVDAIESFAEEQRAELDRKEEEGEILARDAELGKQRIDTLEEEAKSLNRFWYALSAFDMGAVLTANKLGESVAGLIKHFAKLEERIAAVDNAIEEAANASLVSNVEKSFQRPDGSMMGSRSFQGRNVAREDAIESAKYLTEYPGRREKERRDIEVELQELRLRQEEGGATESDRQRINELMIQQQELLKKEADARRDIAVALGHEENLRAAEEEQLRAANRQREIEIDMLQKEQNEYDSRIGYLRATYASEDEIIDALKDKERVHNDLADKYKASGDMAKYYQNKTAAAQAAEEAALTFTKARLEELEIEGAQMQANGASEKELLDVRLQEAEALRMQAAELENVGNKREAERKRVEAQTKTLEAYLAVLQEELDDASGYSGFLDATHAAAGPRADQLRKVAEAQERIASQKMAMGDEAGYWSARSAATQAREQAWLAVPEEQLQEAQNLVEARKSLGASTELINEGLEEENRALAALSIAYVNAGNKQKQWETNLKIWQNEQQMVINTHENYIAQLKRETEWAEVSNANADEMYRARMAEANATDNYADALERVGRLEEADEKRHEARMQRSEANKSYYNERAAEADARADRAELMSGRDDRTLLDPNVFNSRMAAAQASLEAARSSGTYSDILRAENKILELRKQQAQQAEDERKDQMQSIADRAQALADQNAQRMGDRADTDMGVFRARAAALLAAGRALDPSDPDDVTKSIQLATQYFELVKRTADARSDERLAIVQSRYELAKELEEQKLVHKGYSSLYGNQLANMLKQRIKDEDVISEKIRLQTDLIKLQKDEAERSYDSIVRRILGGADVVEEAISTSQLMMRFGPEAITAGRGINTSSAVKVVGRTRDTLTIELGRGSIDRLRGALSGAGAEAFTRTFINELVKRL